jgi:hypothetical protein
MLLCLSDGEKFALENPAIAASEAEQWRGCGVSAKG